MVLEKLIPKILLSIIIIVILVATILGIRQKNKTTYATINSELMRAMEYEQVHEGDEGIEIDKEKYPDAEYPNDIFPYVQFDAFFLRDLNGDGIAEKIRGTCKEVGKEDTLYMELKLLTDGYIEEGATIEINGDRNFYFTTTIVKDNEIKEDYIGSNIGKIELKQIGDGSKGIQKLLTGIVRSGEYWTEYGRNSAIGDNINNYSKKNTITFKGTHVRKVQDGEVGEKEERVEIEKTVEFDMDWYGTANCEIINTTQPQETLTESIDEEKGEINLDFYVELYDRIKELNKKKSEIEVEIPKLNGYNAENVIVTNTDITYKYNKESRILTASSEAVVTEDKVSEGTSEVLEKGGIVTSYPTNKYNIKITYPIQAYDTLEENEIELKIPVQARYEAFNNTNEGFGNPYISNTDSKTIIAKYKKYVKPEQIHEANFKVTVGKYVIYPNKRYIVSKEKPLRMYNELSENEIDDTYEVVWYGYTGNRTPQNVGMTFKDGLKGEDNNEDTFIKTGSDNESMEDVSKTIGIYFSDPSYMLGDDGEIKVYDDETGILLQTFTNENWYRYTSTSPYRFEIGVNHVRVETSTVNNNTSINIHLVKEIDDNSILNKYEREDFDKIEYIKSTLVGYLGEEYNKKVENTAKYEAPITEVGLELSKTIISTQETLKNEIITIEAKHREDNNEQKWQNSTFLLKLPKEIIDVKINSIGKNNEKVNIVSQEQYKQTEEDGEYTFIKIVTENETEETFDIFVDCDITSNPTTLSASGQIELYAYNERGIEYNSSAEDKYDINNNLVITDKIGKVQANIQLISPQTLLTAQSAYNYDNKGSKVFAPQVAEVSKETKEATLDIYLVNNYSNKVSEVKVLGKIPFTGNTYVMSGGKLNSSITTELIEGSVTLPEKLRENAKIYYTEKENPNKNIEDDTNEWTEEPEDFSRIKAFLIDFGDYAFTKGEEEHITYRIKMPDNVEYNQYTYAHHAVYFSLETEEGKYRTQIEPNKVGFRIVKKYDLELTKYQLNTNKTVAGATYSIEDEETKNKVSKVTDAQGKLKVEDLYLGITYVIKEMKTPEQYELNENEIKFKTKEEEGKLVLEPLSDNYKKLEVEKVENEANVEYKVVVEVEDKVKGNLHIKKVEKETENKVKGVQFVVKGRGLPQNGTYITTNAQGEANLKGLYIGEPYTLEEVRNAEGYYLSSQIITVTITEENNEYGLNVAEQEEKEKIVRDSSIKTTENIPEVSIEIENRKIPRYELEIEKIEKVTEGIVTENELEAKVANQELEQEINHIEGAKFKLYKGKREIGEYVTDVNGKITIPDLYVYEEKEGIEQQYTLKEVEVPEGYAKVKDITFRVVKTEEGGIEFEETVEEGQTPKKYEIQENKVKLTIEDSPSFKLIKRDKETQEELADIKFAIYNVDAGEKPATNSKGEILGTKEIIDGKEYYTLKTNAKGEITADLTEGFYKAVEVGAPEKYDIKNNVYYFGIGVSREGKQTLSPVWAKGLGSIKATGSTYHTLDSNIRIEKVDRTKDNGYIVLGQFYNMGYYDTNEGLNLGEDVNGNEIVLYNTMEYGNMLVMAKYNSELQLEWARNMQTTLGFNNDIFEVSMGGYLLKICFEQNINIGKNLEGEEVTLYNKGDEDVAIIKYDYNGIVEWATAISGENDDYIKFVSQTKDNGFIVFSNCESKSINVGKDREGEEIILNNKTTEESTYSSDKNDGYIVKYSKDGIVEWTSTISGNKEDSIDTVIKTKDEEYIVNVDFNSKSINLGKDEHGEDVIIDNSNQFGSTAIVKYNQEGKVQWKNVISATSTQSGSMNYSIKEVSNGYIAYGYYTYDNLNLGKDKNGKEIILKHSYNSSSYNYREDGIIIKYDINGELEWAKGIGGNDTDIINCVIETKEGYYIVGGRYESNSVSLGNNESGNEIVLNSGKGMLIKYDSLGNLKSAKAEDELDSINSIIEKSEDEYFVFDRSMNVYIYDINDEMYKIAQGLSANSMIKTEDNGFIFTSLIDIWGNSYNLGKDVRGEDVIVNSGIVFAMGDTEYHTQDTIIIKYNEKMEIEWIKPIMDVDGKIFKVKEDEYVLFGDIYSKYIELGKNIDGEELTFSDKGCIIAKYVLSEVPEVITKENKVVGGEKDETFSSIDATNDGGYIVGGNFTSEKINIGQDINGKEVELKKENDDYTDGMIIKYNENSNVEWTKTISGTNNDNINEVHTCSDDGYIVIGNFSSNQIKLGQDINGQEITLENNGQNTSDVMIIKYNSKGELEWSKAVGGTGDENTKVIKETKDKGYIIAVNFKSTSIELENGVLIGNNGETDGLIIKYNTKGEFEWAKAIGGEKDDEIVAIAVKKDGTYIIGGSFESNNIKLGLNIEGENVELKNSNVSEYRNYSCGMLIKYKENGLLEWAKLVGSNSSSDEVYSVLETKDGGYIVTGYCSGENMNLGEGENGKDVIIDLVGRYIIKYREDEKIEWVKNHSYQEIIQTDDDGFMMSDFIEGSTYYVDSDIIIYGNNPKTYKTDGIIVKCDANGDVEWAKKIGGLNDDIINCVCETKNKDIIAVGSFDSESINLANHVVLTNNGGQDAMILRMNAEMGARDEEELLVENKLKEYKITTDIEEIDGVRGGKISGIGKDPYEIVKYEGENILPITMTPEEGYEIVKITVNGEIQDFTITELDGSYTLPEFTEVKENKHIVVTFAKTSTKFVLNKIDKDGKPLAGAKFKIEQIDKRESTDGAIGEVFNNGENYVDVANTDIEIEGIFGDIQKNGVSYNVNINRDKEVKGVLKEEDKQDDEYCFIKTEKEDGTTYYEPTNGKTYRNEHYGENDGIENSIAHSYIPIDLRDYPKDVVVIIEARVSSDSNFWTKNGEGYATITNTTDIPMYFGSSAGNFMHIYGTIENKEYTSGILEGGNIYYLHLGYKRSYAGSSEDRVVINSIKIYEAIGDTYYFEKNGEGYASNNQNVSNTLAHSYIPIDLSDRVGQKVTIVANAEISSSNGIGKLTISNSTEIPGVDRNMITGATTDLAFMSIKGEQAAKDYETIIEVQEGKNYYLHLYYYGDYINGNENAFENIFKINNIKAYEVKQIRFGFDKRIENEETKYVSNNKGKKGTIANSCIPIDLEKGTEKYNVIINAEISCNGYGNGDTSYDYGYAIITTDSTPPSYYYLYGDENIIIPPISGRVEPTEYTKVLEGGHKYYLHLVYYKSTNTAPYGAYGDGDDTFTINSIKVVRNREHLYDTEVTTDAKGQAFAQLPMEPTPDYTITEIEAPEGYELLKESKIYTMKEGEENKLDINNTKKPKLIVHHYLKGTDVEGENLVKVAEDEIYIKEMGEEYETHPKAGLDKYELEREETGGYKIPENWKGTIDDENDKLNEENELIVTYYYTYKKIPLIVHHYIEGTTNKVLLANGEEAKDKVMYGDKDERYVTEELKEKPTEAEESKEYLNEKYILSNKPSNAEGQYDYPEVEVTYEYRIKTYEVRTKVTLHEETDELGETKQVAGGTISGGEEKTAYEIIKHGDSNKREIIITPEEDYQIKSIKINGQEIGEDKYEIGEEGKITLKEIENITEDQEIEVEFEKKAAKVIVYHYVYDRTRREYTEEKVRTSNGETIESQEIAGKVGERYVTKAVEDLEAGYEIYEEPENSSGIITKDVEEVKYYYATKGARITSNIRKDGTEIITSKDEEVNYKITYSAQIENYEGNATIIVTDTLPYALDKEKMKEVASNKGIDTTNDKWLEDILAGGKYEETEDDQRRPIYKITWTEDKQGINTTEQESGQVEILIEKEISVIYKGVNVEEKNFTNKVKGTIELKELGQIQSTTIAKHTTKAEYIKNIKVTKTWEHGANIYEKPTAVKVYLRKAKEGEVQEEPVAEYELNQENNWTHIFEHLPKYDESTGEEIEYIVEEKPIEGENLDYYKRK